MSSQTNGLYEFGLYRLDAAKRLLTRDTEPVTLAPKAFDLLLLLVTSGGRLLEKQELMDALWPDTFVEEANLPFQIAGLRKALGEQGAEWIETVPKHGYRFTVPIKQVDGDNRRPESLDQPQSPRRPWLPWALAAATLFALGAGAVLVLHYRGTAPEEHALQLSVSVPENSLILYVAISPDGRKLAVGLAREGKNQLWLRSLDSAQFRPLSGTDRARTPFWSPDSGFIAFFAEGKLKAIPATGGPAQSLCGDTGLGYGGAWNRDGVILFGSESGPLRRVNSAGGACSPIGDATPGGRTGLPEFLPDGKHFLYLRQGSDDPSQGLYIAALDNPAGRRLLADVSSVIFSPPPAGSGSGHLLFLREGTLVAQPFDAGKLQLTGDPFPVASQAYWSATGAQVAASIAANGTLVYVANKVDRRIRQLTWFDRSGKKLGLVGAPAIQSLQSLSLDGNTAVLGRLGDLCLRDLPRGSETHFPVLLDSPVWSPDRSRIVYSRGAGLYRTDASGEGQEDALVQNGNPKIASDWSRDGRFLLYTEIDPKTSADIWYLSNPLAKPGDTKPVRFLGTKAVETQAQFSPDGHWVAYTAGYIGAIGVYVRPFPSGAGEWRVSIRPGTQPRWSRDGKELYYLEGAVPHMLRLMAVPIQAMPGGVFKAGVPQELFEFLGTTTGTQYNFFDYSPHPDGKRFLVNVQAGYADPTIEIITNL